MRNSPLKAFASPTKDIDTGWLDKVYTKGKVDESLKKKGLHTEGDLRGKKDTTPGQGTNKKAGTQPTNTNMI
jgi:hypothetical protein